VSSLREVREIDREEEDVDMDLEWKKLEDQEDRMPPDVPKAGEKACGSRK
jgi:hypothetical protein